MRPFQTRPSPGRISPRLAPSQRIIFFGALASTDHSSDWREDFNAQIARHPEIVEAHRLAGPTDYLLRVVVRDMAAFDEFYRRLTDSVNVRNVTSHFAMEPVKDTRVLPIDTMNR